MEEIKDEPELIKESSGNNSYTNDVFKSQILINKNRVNNISEIYLNFDDNEKIISNIILQINKENIKDEEEKKDIEKKEKKVVGDKIDDNIDYNNEYEISIKNDFIKLCICKNNKSYIPNLKKVFNFDIYEYNGLDDIMQE